MLKRVLITVIAASLTANASGGMKILTHHSRANCAGFNESISWEFNSTYRMSTTSRHWYYHRGSLQKGHDIIDTWRDTWRSAAYHATEGYGGWKVWGTHQMVINGQPQVVATTYATDCSIYNGWWDH